MKVAIIIPTYNSINFVDQCIESAISQDYKNCEIFVYDNESTDGTYEYLLEKYSNIDNIKIISIENIYSNSYREAFEHAFENIDTDYITFVASDDYLSSDYISNCINIISKNPEKIKCLQSAIIGVENDKAVMTQVHKYKSLSEFKTLCLTKSPVNTPTVIYHKSLYDKLKTTAHIENKISCSGAEDYDMYCNLADNDIFIYPVPIHLGYFYRWHKGQCTWKVHKDPNNYDNIIQTYWKSKWNSE